MTKINIEESLKEITETLRDIMDSRKKCPPEWFNLLVLNNKVPNLSAIIQRSSQPQLVTSEIVSSLQDIHHREILDKNNVSHIIKLIKNDLEKSDNPELKACLEKLPSEPMIENPASQRYRC